MKLSITYLFYFYFLISYSYYGQKSKIYEQKIFAGYFNQTQLTKHLGIWLDLHHRTTDHFVKKNHQFMIRGALTYFVNQNFRIIAGHCYVYNFKTDNTSSFIEHRPWAQLFYKQHNSKCNFIQILRFEQRFFLNTINSDSSNQKFITNSRIRYNQLLQIPLSKDGIKSKKFSLVINNEIFINFGKNIVYNLFDQNRAFIGIGYLFSKNTNIQAGYMNIIQQTSAGNVYKISNCIRVFLFQNFDLRKEGNNGVKH